MARFKSQRLGASALLYALTVVWLALWVFGWISDAQELAEPAFYVAWTFVAASLVFMGLRGAIEE